MITTRRPSQKALRGASPCTIGPSVWFAPWAAFFFYILFCAASCPQGSGLGVRRGGGAGAGVWCVVVLGGWFGRRDSLYSLSVVGMPLPPRRATKGRKLSAHRRRPKREVLASLSLKSRPRLFAGVTNRQACYILFRFDFFLPPRPTCPTTRGNCPPPHPLGPTVERGE